MSFHPHVTGSSALFQRSLGFASRYTREQLENLPSEKHGLSAENERAIRVECVKNLEQSCRYLRFPYKVACVASTCFHKYFLERSIALEDCYAVAAACLFVSQKSFGFRVRVLDIGERVYANANIPPQHRPSSQQQLCERVCDKELSCMQAVNFEGDLNLPHELIGPIVSYLVQRSQLSPEGARNLSILSFKFCCYSFRSALCVLFPQQHIAAACMEIAFRLGRHHGVDFSPPLLWFQLFMEDMQMDLLDALISEIVGVADLDDAMKQEALATRQTEVEMSDLYNKQIVAPPHPESPSKERRRMRHFTPRSRPEKQPTKKRKKRTFREVDSSKREVDEDGDVMMVESSTSSTEVGDEPPSKRMPPSAPPTRVQRPPGPPPRHDRSRRDRSHGSNSRHNSTNVSGGRRRTSPSHRVSSPHSRRSTPNRNGPRRKSRWGSPNKEQSPRRSNGFGPAPHEHISPRGLPPPIKHPSGYITTTTAAVLQPPSGNMPSSSSAAPRMGFSSGNPRMNYAPPVSNPSQPR